MLFAEDSRTPVREQFAFVRALVRELRKRTQSPDIIVFSFPQVFYVATAFAGEYPLMILWGVLVPLMALTLPRRKSGFKQRNDVFKLKVKLLAPKQGTKLTLVLPGRLLGKAMQAMQKVPWEKVSSTNRQQ